MLFKKLRNKCFYVCSIALMFVFMMFSAGCSLNKSSATTSTTKYGTTYDEFGRIIDNDVSEKIRAEECLIAGQLTISGDIVNVTMVAKDEANKKDIKSVGDKYLNLAKEKYKDKKVWVQIVQKDQNVYSEKK